LVLGYIPPSAQVPEVIRQLEIARATLTAEQMKTAAPTIIKTVTGSLQLQQALSVMRGLPPETQKPAQERLTRALIEGNPTKALTIIRTAKEEPPKKTQAQIYEENWEKFPTLAEWAKLWGIPVEQSPFKLGEEGRKYGEKMAKIQEAGAVRAPPAPPPAEAPSWLPIAVLIGAAYLLTRRK